MYRDAHIDFFTPKRLIVSPLSKYLLQLNLYTKITRVTFLIKLEVADCKDFSEQHF